jgi:hypothetical protein
MTVLSMLELFIAALMIGAGVWIYRQKPAEGETEDVNHYGSQGAVLLFVVAVIMVIHGVGALQYHPSSSELEMAKGLAQMGHRN